MKKEIFLEVMLQFLGQIPERGIRLLIHGTSPTKFINTDSNNSVYHRSSGGACFYDDIWVCEDFRKNKPNSSGYSTFPRGYKDTLNKGKSIFTGDFNNNNSYFKLMEVEVFKVFK